MGEVAVWAGSVKVKRHFLDSAALSISEQQAHRCPLRSAGRLVMLYQEAGKNEEISGRLKEGHLHSIVQRIYLLNTRQKATSLRNLVKGLGGTGQVSEALEPKIGIKFQSAFGWLWRVLCCRVIRQTLRSSRCLQRLLDADSGTLRATPRRFLRIWHSENIAVGVSPKGSQLHVLSTWTRRDLENWQPESGDRW